MVRHSSLNEGGFPGAEWGWQGAVGFPETWKPTPPPPTWISGTPDSLPPNQWFSARGGFVSGAVWGYFGIYNLGGIGLASSG